MNQINRLYIHVPFCQSKCAYCAFHSIPISGNDTLINKYFAKLKNDINKFKLLTSPLKSIFIGGGTPSFLNTKDIEKLFTLIYNNFIITKDTEVTMENNPESLTEEKINIISNFVNRVSLGIQSFNEKHRSIIGRIGSNRNIYNVIDTLIKYKIDNISADLIFGIPTQTLDDWKKELKNVIKIPIKHLSTYALTIEEGTKLYSSKNIKSLDDDTTVDMWNLTSDLSQAGLERYEVSNFSIPGYECKHNLDTWFGGKYLGLGPTASSFDGKTRWTEPILDEWLIGKQPDTDYLSPYERIIEIFIMGLRTSHGWMIEQLETGNRLLISKFPHHLKLNATDWEKLDRKLSNLHNAGLLNIENIDSYKMRISPTEHGLLFWNEIALELL